MVKDLNAVLAFFEDLGIEIEGGGPVEGPWVEQLIGVEGVSQEVAMLRLPDGPGRIELAQFHTPKPIRSEPIDAPGNTLGIRRVMFAVDDIDEVVSRLCAAGSELVGEVVNYENVYRLCYLRGPDGIVVGLAQEIG